MASDTLRGKLVVLLGGSGFLGNYVAQALLTRGARLRIASRRPEKAFALRPLANLGQIQFAHCDVTNRASADHAIAGADAVVNLVGSFDGDLARLMGEAPAWMAAGAREHGAGAFVHVSAIADPGTEDAPIAYGQAKALGESCVREEFPSATIVRPSVLFARDDGFVQMLAGLISKFSVLPVFGPGAKLQPAYADDVAEAVAVALEAPGAWGGKIVELGGPEVMTMLELNRRIADAQHRRRHFVALPDPVSALLAMLPGAPLNSDQWRMLLAGNVVSGKHPGFAQLGIQPKPLGLFLDRWMVQYRKNGRFGLRVSAER